MEIKKCLTNFILPYPAASLPLDLGPLVFDDSVKKKSKIFSKHFQSPFNRSGSWQTKIPQKGKIKKLHV
jgi:hypothetical protein